MEEDKQLNSTLVVESLPALPKVARGKESEPSTEREEELTNGNGNDGPIIDSDNVVKLDPLSQFLKSGIPE